VFEALNLPYINVGKDPYLVTFCTEPIFGYGHTYGQTHQILPFLGLTQARPIMSICLVYMQQYGG